MIAGRPLGARPWLPVCWATALTAAILWPVLTRPGFSLGYDMVFVPDQPLKPWMWGAGDAPPRAVPQDLYVALIDQVVAGWLLQRILLVGAVLLSALGMAVLLGPLGRLSQLVGMTFYVWSAWVFERLVIGHWGLLLGYAACPWVLHLAARARSRDSGRGAAGLLVLVVFAGTWVPTGGVLLTGLAVAVLLWPGPDRRPWWVLGSLALVQASWVVPAVRAAPLPQGSASVFGIRGDGDAGALVTALAGSGIWNPATVAESRTGILAWVAAGVAVLAVVAGFRPLARQLGRSVVGPLTLVAVLGLGWAVLTGVDPARALVAWVDSLPGGGLLRDGHKWLAPWWLLVSAAAGAAAAELQHRARPDSLHRLAGVLAIVPLVLLPDLAGGVSGRLTPHVYPADWDAVREVLAAADDGAAVVSVPWSAFRRYGWNGDRVVLDPAPRYLPGEVLASSDLLVRGPEGVLTLPSDDPADRAVAAALTASAPVAALERLGVGWLLVQRDQPAGPLGEDLTLPGAETAYQGQWLTLLRLPAPVPRAPDPGFPWATWLVVGVGLIGAGIAAFGRGNGSSRRHP